MRPNRELTPNQYALLRYVSKVTRLDVTWSDDLETLKRAGYIHAKDRDVMITSIGKMALREYEREVPQEAC